MRKSHVMEILARRLSIAPGRIQAIAERLATAGLLSTIEGSRRYPPSIDEPEIINLIVAVICDNGLGSVRQTVATFVALPSTIGTFGDTLHRLLCGQPHDIASLIIRQEPAGVSIIIDRSYVNFGAEAPEKAATTARIIPGDALIAIAAELQGQHPQQADALIELIKIRRSL